VDKLLAEQCMDALLTGNHTLKDIAESPCYVFVLDSIGNPYDICIYSDGKILDKLDFLPENNSEYLIEVIDNLYESECNNSITIDQNELSTIVDIVYMNGRLFTWDHTRILRSYMSIRKRSF
jgi:hypothetical protein